MDIQIMLKSLEISLEEIVDISNIEIDIRKQISKCFELPNLTRHRASVFIKKERESYMQ
jgi:hypothetical protein